MGGEDVRKPTGPRPLKVERDEAPSFNTPYLWTVWTASVWRPHLDMWNEDEVAGVYLVDTYNARRWLAARLWSPRVEFEYHPPATRSFGEMLTDQYEDRPTLLDLCRRPDGTCDGSCKSYAAGVVPFREQG